MWCAIEPIIKEKEHLFSFSPMAEALNKVTEPPFCVESQPLKSCPKTNNANLGP